MFKHINAMGHADMDKQLHIMLFSRDENSMLDYMHDSSIGNGLGHCPTDT